MEGRQVSHYEIVRLLGRGGMGEVWEAVDLHLDRRPVALKFLSADLARDAESLARFEREASSAARLKHPHIATVHAFVRDGAPPFIDMELLTGGSLRDRMGGGPLAVPTALAIARDVASGLAHAHRRGVIHRDIKPENLMFDDEGRVRVADFGLARATQASKLTMTGTTLGTATYMAPESVRGEAGASADVFALGAVLYEMLAGRPPFTGDQPLALMYAIANQAPVPIHERRPDVPKPVADLVERLLEKDAAKRPDAAETARVLSEITGIAPPRFEPVTEDHEVERLLRRDTVRLLAPAGSQEPRRRPARVAAVLLALFGAVGAAIVLLVVLPVSGARARRDAVALNNRGIEALRADSLQAAERWFEQATERDPKFPEAGINLASLLRRRGERDRAAQLLGGALRHARDSTLKASAYSGLADIELDTSNFEAAIENLRHAVALAPASDVYANNLGFGFIRAGRFTDAWQVLEPALARFPERPALLKNAGLALLRLDRAKDAVPLLDRAIRLSPEYASAWGVRALARASSGDPGGARADFEAFSRLVPDPAEHESVRRELERTGVVVDGGGGAGGGAGVPSSPQTPLQPAAPLQRAKFRFDGSVATVDVLLQEPDSQGRTSCSVLAQALTPETLLTNLEFYRKLAGDQRRMLVVRFHDRSGGVMRSPESRVTYDGRPLTPVAEWCTGGSEPGEGVEIPLR